MKPYICARGGSTDLLSCTFSRGWQVVAVTLDMTQIHKKKRHPHRVLLYLHLPHKTFKTGVCFFCFVCFLTGLLGLLGLSLSLTHTHTHTHTSSVHYGDWTDTKPHQALCHMYLISGIIWTTIYTTNSLLIKVFSFKPHANVRAFNVIICKSHVAAL